MNYISKKKNSFVLPQIFEKNLNALLLCLKKKKTLYQHCEICGPWVRGPGPRADQIYTHIENVLHHRKSSSHIHF